MGIPFVAVRTILGSDLLKIRPDFHEINYEGKKYVQVPSIYPDVAIVHAYAADPYGNVYYPEHHILDDFSSLPALCSKTLFVTVEKMIDEKEGREFCDQIMFSYLDVDFIAEAPNGAWPSAFPPFYGPDMGHLMTYSGMSRTLEGFRAYLDENVFKQEDSE